MPSANWQPGKLVSAHVLAALLGGTLIWSSSAEVWIAIDTSVFYFLNGSLSWSTTWAYGWAITNSKSFDVVVALLFLAPLVTFVKWDRHSEISDRVARAILLLLMVVVAVGISKLLLPRPIHPSPSLVLNPFLSLRELVPGISAKVSSSKSFPGDHAVFAFTYMALSFRLLDAKYALAGTVIGALYVVPRLVAGGHWFSDDLVGGGIAALLTYSWALHIPCLHWLRHACIWLLHIPFIQKTVTLVGLEDLP